MYAWHIKIIAQTEGFAVAQSRPGKCLNHSAGGETAGGNQEGSRGGDRHYSRGRYCRKRDRFEGIGGSGTALAPLGFSH